MAVVTVSHLEQPSQKAQLESPVPPSGPTTAPILSVGFGQSPQHYLLLDLFTGTS